jgi:hypothetical protein
MKAKTPALARESGESMKELGAAIKSVGNEILHSYDRIKKILEK